MLEKHCFLMENIAVRQRVVYFRAPSGRLDYVNFRKNKFQFSGVRKKLILISCTKISNNHNRVLFNFRSNFHCRMVLKGLSWVFGVCWLRMVVCGIVNGTHTRYTIPVYRVVLWVRVVCSFCYLRSFISAVRGKAMKLHMGPWENRVQVEKPFVHLEGTYMQIYSLLITK